MQRGPPRRRTFSKDAQDVNRTLGAIEAHWLRLSTHNNSVNLNRTLGVIAAGSPGKSNIFHVTSLIRWQDPEHATQLFPPSFDCEFLFTALCVLAEAALRTSLLMTPGLRAILH